MTKWMKNDIPSEPITTQVEISDEAAALWRSNGNMNISDEPWPGLKVVQGWIVDDRPPGDSKS